MTAAQVAKVASKFGPDIAHDVYLFTQDHPVPASAPDPLRWVMRTARFTRGRQETDARRHRASEYRWTPLLAVRPATPDRIAAAWELLDKVPRLITEELVMLEGVGGTVASRRRDNLRRRARRLAAGAALALLALVLPTAGYGQPQVPVVGVAHLNWNDNSTDEIVFNIERKAEACDGTAAPFVPAASVAANVLVYHDILWALGTYCYRVFAANPSGASEYSNVAERTYAAPEVPGPGVLGVGAVVKTSAALNVRVAPGGALAGPFQPSGSFGIIVNGPLAIQGQNWWEVDYDASTPPGQVHRGWSVQSTPACPATLCLLAQ